MASINETANPLDTNDAEVIKGGKNKPMMLPIGEKVSINRTTLVGVVSGYHISKDNHIFSYLVEYYDDGEKHEKAFLPNQITEKKEDSNG